VRVSSWSLPALSTAALLVIGGSVVWAEATHAAPHAGTAAVSPSAGPSFSVCAHGDFPAYVQLTGTPKKSGTAQPGKCVTETVADANTVYRIQIYGLDGTRPFLIGDDEVSGGDGEKVTVTGTAENPDWVTE
jgi:hypothetical protein